MDKPGNEMHRQIGQRIREVRTKRGMSQQDLATGADISLPHISEIELGKTQMRVSTLIRIAEALQISTDVLLRPNIPQVNSMYQTELQELIGDCTPAEMESIFKIVREMKSVMHTQKNDET